MRLIPFKGAMVLRISVILGAAALLLSSSCTKIGNYAEKKADSAAYGNIHGAQLAGMGEFDPFSIGAEDQQMINDLLEMDQLQEEAKILSLADTLAIALANSRSYKTQKESLFIQALNLTETQKDFSWDYSAAASASSIAAPPMVSSPRFTTWRRSRRATCSASMRRSRRWKRPPS